MKKQINKATLETLEASSIHAIPNIVRTKYSTLKIIWGSCLFVSIGLCGWYLFQIISAYLDNETVTKFQINNVHQLQFPIVSLCNLKSFYDQQENKGIGLDIIKTAFFLENEIVKENEFDTYEDPNYGRCLRFNSGKI